MAQVNDQAGLRAALGDGDPDIQLTGSFTLTSSITIKYPVTIRSISPDTRYTITKADTYYTYLIRISDGGSLTLKDIIIDGNAASRPMEDENNRSLFFVIGGTLVLSNGAVVQNNHSYKEGGGVYLSGADTYHNVFLMEGDAKVTGCSSRVTGGGVMAALRHNDDRVTLKDNALLSDNSAANGGGLYYRSYLDTVGVPLTIEGNVQFLSNRATANGGGLYVSSFVGGTGPAVPLTISGPVTIQANQANYGGGLYYNAGSSGDQLFLGNSVDITGNSALLYGGGLYLKGGGTADLEGGSIRGNQTSGGGGGLYNTDGFRTEIHGTQIYANQAAIGGAVYNQNGGSVYLYEHALIGLPEPNTATRYAPGLYNEEVFETADQPDLTNGLYIANRSSVAQIVRPLTTGAVIQLDQSGYVTPDPAASPIVVAEATAGYPLLRAQDAGAFRKPVTGFDGWEIRLNDDRTQVWLALAPVTHQLTYQPNDSSCAPAQCIPLPVQVLDGQTIRLSPAVPLRCGYCFVEWNTTPDGTGIAYRPCQVLEHVTADITLYAQWIAVSRPPYCCCQYEAR